MPTQPDIIISNKDLAGIERWIEVSRLPKETAELIENELARATIVSVDQVPATTVAIGNTVTFRIEETGSTFTKTLCYPNDVAKFTDGLSILAPVGAAIIGLSVGQQIEWPSQKSSQNIVIIQVTRND